MRDTDKCHCYVISLPSPLFLSIHTVIEPQQINGSSDGPARALQKASIPPEHGHHVLRCTVRELSLKEILGDPMFVSIAAVLPLAHMCLCLNRRALLSLGQVIDDINRLGWSSLKLQVCVRNSHIDVLGSVEEFRENRSLQ